MIRCVRTVVYHNIEPVRRLTEAEDIVRTAGVAPDKPEARILYIAEIRNIEPVYRRFAEILKPHGNRRKRRLAVGGKSDLGAAYSQSYFQDIALGVAIRFE